MAIPRLLVVDDDPDMRQMMCQYLRQHGCIALPAATEADVHRHLDDGRIDLVLLDVMLGDESGLEICQGLRRDHDVPIIMVSALSADHQRMAGYETGADDYIAKPFGPRELIARVKAITRRATNAPTQMKKQDTPFQMDHLSVDPKSLRAKFDDKTIQLTMRELKVLEMLYENKGKVLSRLELFEECWGRRYMANSRALDQFISQLRQKIELDQSNPTIIRTVHGVGYRYEN